MRKLFIVGAGGHGKVALDVAHSMGLWTEISYLDDRYPDLKKSGKSSISGSTKQFTELVRETRNDWFVAIGNTSQRMSFINKYGDLISQLTKLIHSSAILSPSTKLSAGCIAMPGTVINCETSIGVGSIINTRASIDHDCKISAGVHIAPATVLGGGVTVGENSWLGIGATILNNINIGSNCIVGAGAVVTEDVPDNTKVIGIPARRANQQR